MNVLGPLDDAALLLQHIKSWGISEVLVTYVHKFYCSIWHSFLFIGAFRALMRQKLHKLTWVGFEPLPHYNLYTLQYDARLLVNSGVIKFISPACSTPKYKLVPVDKTEHKLQNR